MNIKLISGVILFIGLGIAGWVFFGQADTEDSEAFQYVAGVPCHSMGDFYMGECEFNKNGEIVLDEQEGFEDSSPQSVNLQQDEKFSVNTDGLPEAEPSKILEVQDGGFYELEAGYVKQTINGIEMRRLAYNGMIPGPTFKAKRGSQITVVFKNNLDFETTVHAHGLRGESKYDGVPKSIGGEQNPVAPGNSFTYIWDFPDTGLFWYHPHIRTDYTTDAGLQGNFFVAEDNYWNEVDREELLVLDDVSPQGPFYTKGAIKTLMGRFGDIMLINNKENYQVEVQQGETIRFFLTNTANTRTFDLKIENTDMRLVGSDIGRIEQEEFVESIIIAPSERYVFESSFNVPGTFKIFSRNRVLGTIVVNPSDKVQTKPELRNNSDDFRVIKDNLQELLSRPADKKLTIDIDMPGMRMSGMMDTEHGNEDPHGDEGIEWEDDMAAMNAVSNTESVTWILRDNNTGDENENIDWSFKKDSLTKIEIYNDPGSMHPMQHPVHFHGQKLVVISRNGIPVDSLQWEDTVLIRTGERIEVILQATNVGSWIAHCHISEHAEAGMRFNFSVE